MQSFQRVPAVSGSDSVSCAEGGPTAEAVPKIRRVDNFAAQTRAPQGIPRHGVLPVQQHGVVPTPAQFEGSKARGRSANIKVNLLKQTFRE